MAPVITRALVVLVLAAAALGASAGGLGIRSKRYSMIVEDGVVKSLNVEEAPGKAELSGADALLKQL